MLAADSANVWSRAARAAPPSLRLLVSGGNDPDLAGLLGVGARRVAQGRCFLRCRSRTANGVASRTDRRANPTPAGPPAPQGRSGRPLPRLVEPPLALASLGGGCLPPHCVSVITCPSRLCVCPLLSCKDTCH